MPSGFPVVGDFPFESIDLRYHVLTRNTTQIFEDQSPSVLHPEIRRSMCVGHRQTNPLRVFEDTPMVRGCKTTTVPTSFQSDVLTSSTNLVLDALPPPPLMLLQIARSLRCFSRHLRSHVMMTPNRSSSTFLRELLPSQKSINRSARTPCIFRRESCQGERYTPNYVLGVTSPLRDDILNGNRSRLLGSCLAKGVSVDIAPPNSERMAS